MSLYFKNENEVIYLLGKNEEDLNCSEYLHKLAGVEYSPAPYFNLDEEFALHQNIKQLIADKLVTAAHDVAEGGLFISLVECGFFKKKGFNVFQQNKNIRPDAYWFGEAQGRVVVTVSPENTAAFEKALTIPFEKLGTVTGKEITVDGNAWGSVLSWKEKYDNAIGKYLANEL